MKKLFLSAVFSFSCILSSEKYESKVKTSYEEVMERTESVMLFPILSMSHIACEIFNYSLEHSDINYKNAYNDIHRISKGSEPEYLDHLLVRAVFHKYGLFLDNGSLNVDFIKKFKPE